MSTDSAADILAKSDVEYLRAVGREPAEVVRQIVALRQPRSSPEILRAATLGDGVIRISDYSDAALQRAHADASAAGRVSHFVPASGSGTRLFESLLKVHRGGETSDAVVRARASRGDHAAINALTVLERIHEFAFWPEIQHHGVTGRSVAELVDVLFGALHYHDRAKGLIPIHRYGDVGFTAFDEHVEDARHIAADGEGRPVVHFTVAPSQVTRFEEAVERVRERSLAERRPTPVIRISLQSPSADAIAVDERGDVVRGEDGRILLRPGGHGALLSNLSGHDVVFVRNIDNVTTRRRSIPHNAVRARMCGVLLLVEEQIHEAVRNLRAGIAPRSATDRLRALLPHVPLTAPPSSASVDEWLDALNRPIRVCGVVQTTGHAGGKAVWTAGENGRPSLQIVEGAELGSVGGQAKTLLREAPFFNPVDMVCSLRDSDRRPFDLRAFVNHRRVIVNTKSINGAPALVYEHPGLWNGGMAGWVTVFVEIPAETFSPIKSILDLLNEAHRPDGA